MAQVLRTEFMQLIEQLSEEVERKQFKHANKFESYTINCEGRFSKLTHDLKKAVKLSEKVSI